MIAGPGGEPAPTRGTTWWAVAAVAAVLAVAAAGAVLYRFEPDDASFYPRCAFHTLTGLHCPGCGATRALHRLLHGRPLEALAYNPMVVLALPYFLYTAASWAAWRRTGRRWRQPFRSAWSVWLLLALILTYTVLRNLPWEPFRRLAPGAWWG